MSVNNAQPHDDPKVCLGSWRETFAEMQEIAFANILNYAPEPETDIAAIIRDVARGQ